MHFFRIIDQYFHILWRRLRKNKQQGRALRQNNYHYIVMYITKNIIIYKTHKSNCPTLL